MRPLAVSAYTLNNALGAGRDASLDGLRNENSGLRRCDMPGVDLDTWIGRVSGLDEVGLPDRLRGFDCRNNRLAYQTLLLDEFAERTRETVKRLGADRVGLFLGTSTSGVAETERAYAEAARRGGRVSADFPFQKTHNVDSMTQMISEAFGIAGPAMTISTACSSSAKVFAAAHRYIDAGVCDAALVGGVDSLCEMTLYGFNSLELVSSRPCRPWDANRNGISIGEAAGFALLEATEEHAGCQLTGYGESSDAYHIATPHPEGAGAALAMRAALERAGLAAQQVDYVNLHGTGTPRNDAAEDQAMTAVFGNAVACSSTKGWVGHCLGAAGITEALFCVLMLENGLIPGCLNCANPDPALNSQLVRQTQASQPQRMLSNSFGFGGNNCSLLFEVGG